MILKLLFDISCRLRMMIFHPSLILKIIKVGFFIIFFWVIIYFFFYLFVI